MIKIIAANSQIEAMFSDREIKKDGKDFCIFCEKSRQILEHGAKPQEVYKRFRSDKSYKLSPSMFEEARDYFHENFNCREDIVSVFDNDGNVVGYLYWVRNRLRDSSIYPGIPAEDFWEYDFKGKPVNDFVLNWAECYVFSQLEEYTYAIARYILDRFPDRNVYFSDQMADLNIWGKAQERVKVIDSFYDLPEKFRRNCMQITTSEYNAYSEYAPESKNLTYNSVNIMYSMLWGSHILHPGCKYPDKVIVRIDNKFASAGLVDIIKATMNIAYQAKMQGYVPVADLSQEGCCQYWEPGANVWEELFKPLSNIRPEETEECANLISARKEERGWLVSDWRSNPMWREADYRALAQGEWEGQPYLNSKAWEFVKGHAPGPLRRRINDLAATEEKEKAFVSKHDDMRILGVIIRGTDYRKEVCTSKEKNANNASVEQMLAWCKGLMAIGRYDYLFLATEDEDYFRLFREAFPADKLLYVDQPRVHINLSSGKRITTDVLFKKKGVAGLELAKLYLTTLKCLVVCDDIISSMDNGTYRQAMRWNAGRYSWSKIVKDGEILPVVSEGKADNEGLNKSKVEALKQETIKNESSTKMGVTSVAADNYYHLLSNRRRAWWVDGDLLHMKKPELLRKGDLFITSSDMDSGRFVYGAPVCRPEALKYFEEKPLVLLLLDDESEARRRLRSYEYREGEDFYGWNDFETSKQKERKIAKVQREKQQKSNSYDEYLRRYGQVTELDRIDMAKDIASFAEMPLISIIMPVYNPLEEFFRQALDSVLAQVYTRWELCIADDASSEQYVKKIIEEYRHKDARIKVVYRKENGHICKAENSALELTSGEFTALMDHDDILHPEALYCVAKEINTSSDAVDMIYTDMDYIDGDGHRSNPRFGGDFDPIIFASWNNVAHLDVYRTKILKEIGGFSPGYEGSQDYDLALRFFKHVDVERIHHVPHVCYSWRRFPGYATVSAAAGLSKAQDAAFRALKDFYADDDKVEVDRLVNIQAKPKLPVPAPMVSVIVSNEDVDALRKCMDSILSLTDYNDYEIIIIDSLGKKQELANCLGEVYKKDNVHVHKFDKSFNHSAICNFGASKAKGDCFLFLDCGVNVIEPGWLTSMVRELSRNRVGIVGAKLLDEDGKIQHCGIALRGAMIAHNPGAGMRGEAAGYRNILKLTRQCAAVSGQCLLMKRETFEAVRGWDDNGFPGVYGDIDLCLRAREKGWQVVFDAQAILNTFECNSRIDYINESEDTAKREMERKAGRLMIKCHAEELFEDHFYNPNLTWHEQDYSIAKFPAVSKPWRPWAEVVCPVSLDGVILGIQIANHAYRHGVKLRLHVLAEYMPWLSDFRLSFPIRPMSIPASLESEGEMDYSKVLEQVSVLPDSSGLIVGAVPLKSSEQDCKLNMAEYLLCQLRMPIEEKVMPLLPEVRELDEETKSALVGKTALLYVDGESSDSIMPKDVAIRILKVLHETGFRVVQIGNPKSEHISGCEGYVFNMGTLGFWRSVFDKAELVVSTDCWATHLANILNHPRIIICSKAGCRDYCSNLYFKESEGDYLIIKPNSLREEDIKKFVA